MHSNSAVEELAAVCESKFNASASILPFSLLLFLVAFFGIASGQLAELKILILNRWRRYFHSSRVKLCIVTTSASWFWCKHF